MESYLQKSVTRIKDASKRLKDLKAVCDETLGTRDLHLEQHNRVNIIYVRILFFRVL